jgi:prepilin-type N-terminal cleavage/methylation domain-containing protein
MKKNRNLKAFSLIEISIVILIIGILIVGITQSSRLVSQAKVSSARALTQSSPASSIPGMVLWLESSSPQESFSDENIEDGETITIWNDVNPQSSIRSNFTGTLPTYNTDGINSVPALVFSSNDITSGNFPNIGTGTITLFAVVKLPATLAAQTIISKTDDTNANFEFRTTATAASGWEFCDGIDCYTSTSASPVANGSYVVSIVYHDNNNAALPTDTTSGITFLQNGDGVGFAATTGGVLSSNTTSIAVGNSSGATNNFFGGLIGEIIVYDRGLKQEERQSVEDYLGKKWGIRMTAETY